MQDEANDLVRGEIVAAAIHAADAVSVAVGDQAEVVGMLFEEGGTARVIRLDWLRVDPAKEHVVPAVQRGDLARRAGQQFFKAARGYAEQGVVRKAQPGLGDELEVHELLQCGVMGRTDVGDPDLLFFHGVRQSFGSDRIPVQETLDRLTGGWLR